MRFQCASNPASSSSKLISIVTLFLLFFFFFLGQSDRRVPNINDEATAATRKLRIYFFVLPDLVAVTEGVADTGVLGGVTAAVCEGVEGGDGHQHSSQCG